MSRSIAKHGTVVPVIVNSSGCPVRKQAEVSACLGSGYFLRGQPCHDPLVCNLLIVKTNHRRQFSPLSMQWRKYLSRNRVRSVPISTDASWHTCRCDGLLLFIHSNTMRNPARDRTATSVLPRWRANCCFRRLSKSRRSVWIRGRQHWVEPSAELAIGVNGCTWI